MSRSTSSCVRAKRVIWWGAALNALLLLGVIWLLFSAWGAGSPAPQGYVLSQASELQYLTWAPSSGGVIAGQWVQLSQVTGAREPVSQSLGLVGTQTNRQVTITVDATPLTGLLQGRTLQLTVTGTSGHLVAQTWYGASQSDYNALVTAFTAETHLGFSLANLSFTVDHPPLDSDARSYDNGVQAAHQYDQNLLTQEERIRASSDPCASTGIFDQLYPPGDTLFQLTPYATPEEAVSHTTVAGQLSQVRADWHAAQAVTLPIVSGLPLPWVIPVGVEARGEQQGASLYTSLLATLRYDYTKMLVFKQQAQQIGQQVTLIKHAHGC